jgi:hypothetical protein
MLKSIFIFAIVVSISLLFGCEKNQPNAEELNGEWVATEEADTIYVMDKSNFYYSTKTMQYDHYDYSISGDSILIGYSGKSDDTCCCNETLL